MKKEPENDDMRAEYDLTKLKGRVRGKYVDRYNSGTNLVALDEDVASEFQDSESVNAALRSFISSNRNQVMITK